MTSLARALVRWARARAAIHLSALVLALCGLTGPASAETQTPDAKSWAYVTGSLVNVRETPNLSGALATSYAKDTLLRVVGAEGEWRKIKHPETGAAGWMHSDFLKLVPKPAQAAMAPRAAGRTAATTAFDAGGGTPVGTKRKYRMFVYGDSLATNLYQGLQGISARSGFYTVKRRTRGATGLVRDDEYDWYGLMKRHLPKDRPDIAVVTFGGNDRQDFQGGTRIRRFSPPWWRAYRARVDRMMVLLKQHSGQVYWLGLPILRSKRMTADYAKFNAVYKAAAERHGVVYVDTWPTFQAPGGGYTAFGPGINGTREKLRHSDGIHFSHAGCQMLGQRVVEEVQRTFLREKLAGERTAGTR